MVARTLKSLSVLMFVFLSLNASASAKLLNSSLTGIELMPDAVTQRQQIPAATDERISDAVLAGYDSQLLAQSINGTGVRIQDFSIAYVSSIQTARFGAIEFEVEFPFPQNADPCSAHLKIISYRDGTHSVRETLIYGGATRGNVMGVLSCQD